MGTIFGAIVCLFLFVLNPLVGLFAAIMWGVLALVASKNKA